MSRYQKTITFETVFDGDKVTAVLDRLTREDMLAINSRLRLTAFDEDEKLNQSVLRDPTIFPEVMQMTAELIAKKVRSLSGLVDADGAAIGIDVVLTEVYFMSLLAEINGALMSGVQVAEQKEWQRASN